MSVNKRLGGVRRLVRLAELRESIANRAVTGAELLLRQSNDALAAAKVSRDNLVAKNTARANVMRGAFIGAPRTRTAVSDMIASLGDLTDQEEAASAAVLQAADTRDKARAHLIEMRNAAARARVVVIKRQRMIEPLQAELASLREMRDEEDAAEIHAATGAFVS